MQRAVAHEDRVQRTVEPRPGADRAVAAILRVRVVELLLQRPHQAAPVRAEGGHRRLLTPAQLGDAPVALGVVAPGRPRLRDPARAGTPDRALDVQHLQQPLDPRLAEVDLGHQLLGRRAVAADGLEVLEHAVDDLTPRERLLDEEVLDALVLGATQQHDLGAIDAAARAAHLLVVGDDRARRLVVHHEAEVGLVIAHAKGAGRHDRLELVAQQPVLDVDAALGLDLAAVGLGRDPTARQPRRDELGVALGQGVDDARAGQLGQPLGQPREAIGLRRQIDDLEAQARPAQRAAVGPQLTRVTTRAELLRDIGHHAVIGRRGRAQHADAVGQAVEHVADAAVVRAEVVAPVRDAVRLVDHQQADTGGEDRQHLLAELRVVEPLGADQQQIDGVGLQQGRDLAPSVAVGRVDGVRPQAEPACRVDLVAHQRQQRGDDQRGASAALPQQRGRDEVDRRLAPARSAARRARARGPRQDRARRRADARGTAPAGRRGPGGAARRGCRWRCSCVCRR